MGNDNMLHMHFLHALLSYLYMLNEWMKYITEWYVQFWFCDPITKNVEITNIFSSVWCYLKEQVAF